MENSQGSLGRGVARRVRRGALGLLLIVGLLTPSRARALTPMEQGVIAAGATAGAVDLAFMVYDLLMVARHRPPAQAMVAAELTLMTIQVATGLSFVFTGATGQHQLDGTTYPDSMIPVGGLMAAVAVPLLVHGLRAANAPAPGSGMHAHLTIVPAAVTDGTRTVPALVLAGRF